MAANQEQFLWWQYGIIYQIYPRSFQDSNQDGVGDLPGIIQRLDYLKELGIKAIWISPIFPSPMADFGYDVSDFTAVDPMFGTLADFDVLLAFEICSVFVVNYCVGFVYGRHGKRHRACSLRLFLLLAT